MRALSRVKGIYFFLRLGDAIGGGNGPNAPISTGMKAMAAAGRLNDLLSQKRYKPPLTRLAKRRDDRPESLVSILGGSGHP
jgi:hypothetical protein